MTHDRNHVGLHVGDRVSILCRVTAINPEQRDTNVVVETVEDTNVVGVKTVISLNSKQLERDASQRDISEPENKKQPSAPFVPNVKTPTVDHPNHNLDLPGKELPKPVEPVKPLSNPVLNKPTDKK